MKSKTTYVYYAIKTKILIEAYGYFGQANKKVPRWGYFYLEINEYIFHSNLRSHKSRLR